MQKLLTKNTLLSVKNIFVYRQGKTILKDVSLTVNHNDFITIIGPNGAGKSMLLKCLMGFYAPDKGCVLSKKNIRIGYTPQRLKCNTSIPINVQRFMTLGKKNINNLEAVLYDISITHLLDKSIHTLSGGELQRVLLARSLLDDPNLLVLDEPAQNLDISGQLNFYKLLKNIYRKKKISILMVSHDIQMVMACTKTVLCLFQHVCCSGEPKIVTKDPQFIRLFGEDMANMMAVYQHYHSHQHD